MKVKQISLNIDAQVLTFILENGDVVTMPTNGIDVQKAPEKKEKNET